MEGIHDICRRSHAPASVGIPEQHPGRCAGGRAHQGRMGLRGGAGDRIDRPARPLRGVEHLSRGHAEPGFPDPAHRSRHHLRDAGGVPVPQRRPLDRRRRSGHRCGPGHGLQRGRRLRRSHRLGRPPRQRRLAGRRTALEAVMSNPRPQSILPEGLGADTLAVRGGQQRTEFGETAEPVFLTQGYVYEHAADAEAAFAGQADRFIYSRYGNPTVSAFEELMRLIEGAEACFATATGMSAVFTALAALVQSGSRIVAGNALFGATFTVLDKILGKWGVQTDYVRAHVLSDWEEALSSPADVVLFETPSNPMQDVVDVAKVSELAHRAGAVVILDHVFATPVLQKPLELGADVVVYSA